ncbi:two-partner secretion domain-containing protein, partial [Sphingomonas bacterium]|uniref:two-partner secretion domain-containing protein n=1 Tax=Sphingomonas bacterium TaxID=1895847 RepID=UPI001576E907
MIRARHALFLRRRLALTSALGLSLGVVGAPATAQETITPTGPTLQAGTVTFRDNVTTLTLAEGDVNGASLNLGIDVATSKAIVNWQGFDISPLGTVAFTNSSGGNAAILNRVTTADVSQIAGTMTGPANLSVWVINPNGILFGNGAAINVGGLVASTLNLADDNAFLTTDSVRFQDAANTARIGMIDTGGPAAINTSNGLLALIAPQLDLNLSSNAGTGATAFVIATDVSMTTSPGGPLSITVNAGTPLATHAIQGAIVGDRVYALLTPQAAVDALLDLGAATVTNATVSPKGVVVLANNASAVSVPLGGGDSDLLTGLNTAGAAGSATLGSVSLLAAVNGATPSTGGLLAAYADGGTIATAAT